MSKCVTKIFDKTSNAKSKSFCVRANFNPKSKPIGDPGNKTLTPANGDMVGGIGGTGVNVEVNQYEQKPFAIVVHPGSTTGKYCFNFELLVNPCDNIFFSVCLSPVNKDAPKNVKLDPTFATSYAFAIASATLS